MTTEPLAHEQTLAQYLGQASVVGMPPDHAAGAFESLRSKSEEFSSWKRVATPERPDLDIRMRGAYWAAVLDARSGELLGGYTSSGPYTDPAYRGRGVCSEIHYQLDIAGLRNEAAAYTMAGMMTRAATHRLHVERALRDGKGVPAAVLADYDIDENGKAKLREPMTAERHNASAKALRRAEAEEHLEAETAGYSVSFRDADNMRNPDFVTYSARYEGFALAIGLMRDFGADVRATVVGKSTFVQALMNDDLIDSHGVRPAEMCLEDFWRRGEFRSADPATEAEAPPAADKVATFKSEAEFLDWLRPGDPFGNAPRFFEFTEDLVTAAMESLPGQAARQALEDILEQKYASMTA